MVMTTMRKDQMTAPPEFQSLPMDAGLNALWQQWVAQKHFCQHSRRDGSPS
jgi:hypothetical protein